MVDLLRVRQSCYMLYTPDFAFAPAAFAVNQLVLPGKRIDNYLWK